MRVPADWLLILEDDTRVYQQIDLHQLHFDINGDNKKSALIPPIMEFIKASGEGRQCSQTWDCYRRIVALAL